MFINIGENKLQEIDDFMGQKLIYFPFIAIDLFQVVLWQYGVGLL